MRSARLVVAALIVAAPGAASAEPYRLRADAFATAADPSGFVMLQAEAREQAAVFVDAEALVWTGVGLDAANDPEARGEAVLASVRLRDPARYVDARFGRLFYQGGAVRPLHMDGATVGFRSPTGATAEGFAGIPVAPGSVGRSNDWLVGFRSAQSIAGIASVGFSYWQERDGGRIAHSEIGLEGSVAPTRAIALYTTTALDTIDFGVAEARITGTVHDATKRLEVYGLRRNPSRLLPATSLFAALGSYDADEGGLRGSYRVAPRLELSASATIESVGGEPGATQLVRAELWLDDDGKGALGAEARRSSIPDASFSGARAWLRIPFLPQLTGSAEGEVAIPDEPRGRGFVWPWGLFAARYMPAAWVDVAAGFEIGSTPQYATVIGGLLRATGKWGVP
jgi:hypothetical protein